MHLLEELREACKPGGYLHACSSEDLEEIARSTYRTFATTKAAYQARDMASSRASVFFEGFAISSSSGSPAPTVPAPLPASNAGDIEDGVSFLSCKYPPPSDADAPHLENSNVDPPLTINTDELTGTTPCNDAGEIDGDMVLFNNILLYCDALLYWEFRTSIQDGDVGRTFEVIKVCSSVS